MKKLALMIAMALIAATGVQAATLAVWDNDNLVSPTRSNAVTTVAADISAGYLDMGVGLAAPGVGNGSVPWDNALDSFIFTNATSLSSAIAAGHYFSFTVNPDTDKQVDYSNIFARITSNDAGDGVGSSLEVVLMSSITGFADGDEIGSFVATHDPGQGPADVTVTTNNFDLSSVVILQDQPSEVEFRLYVIANGGSYSRIALGHIFFMNGTDDVRVDGTVEDATTLPIIKLASWDNDALSLGVTGTGETNNAAEFVAAGITASDLAQSHRWFNDLANWKNSMWALCSDLSAVTNLSESIASNRYFNIVMEPDAGKQADYTKVSVRITLNSSGGDTSVQFVLMSSITGFNPGDEIGSFTATHLLATPGATDNGLLEMDISGIAALQNITGEVEFRVYLVLNDGNSNRWGIGHIFFVDDADDVVVNGRIEDAPFTAATIISITPVSSSLTKLVIDAPSAASLYYPKGTENLTLGFGDVAHSDTDANPFIVTNLTYSTTDTNGNKVIYVDSTASEKFFGMGGE